MLMSYLGALKTWIYVPVFRCFRPSLYPLRVPAVLLAGATLVIFYLWIQREFGSAAANVATYLLATEASYLLMSAFDWGPVVLQHLCLVGGLAALVRFERTRSLRPLALGFFCLGLGMWDKALFVWILSGISVAGLAVYGWRVWRALSWRNTVIAVAGFLFGALPLVVYNVIFPFQTFRSNAALSPEGLGGKAHILRSTWNGSALFGYIVNDPWKPQPRLPSSALERFSVRLHQVTGTTRQNGFEAVLLGVLLLSALVWKQTWRVVVFCLLAMLIAWLQMALTRDAGGSAHHAVLLWPLPHLLIGVVLGALARRSALLRRGVYAALVVLVGLNLLVLNQYLYQYAVYGAGGSWSDAISGLSNALKGSRAPAINIADWGMLNTLEVLHRGRLPLQDAAAPALGNTPEDDAILSRLMGTAGALWVGHTDNYEEFHGLNSRLMTRAARAGYRKEVVHLIADRNGRAVFEIYRLIPLTAPGRASAGRVASSSRSSVPTDSRESKAKAS